MSGAAEFYDGLAGEYECLFTDWWSAARWHGAVIGGLLVAEDIRAPAAVLDCTCGIGRQALPLASAGYDVTATDLSAVAVRRARAEGVARGIRVALAVADMRDVRDVVEGEFDGAIACDNGGVPISVHGEPGARHASGQGWTWSAAGDYVDVALFTMTESADGWRVTAHETTSRALRRGALTSALRRSGYDEPRWLAPDESGYYQPVVLARASRE